MQVFFLKTPQTPRRRAARAQLSLLAGVVVLPRTLCWGLWCGTVNTGPELVTSAESEWAVPSSELTVSDLFGCIFIQGCCSALWPLFWLPWDPTTQEHGNMINGCLAYALCYISPPHSDWVDRYARISLVCSLSVKQLWLLIFLIMFSKNPENYVFTLDTLFSSHSCLQPSEK